MDQEVVECKEAVAYQHRGSSDLDVQVVDAQAQGVTHNLGNEDGQHHGDHQLEGASALHDQHCDAECHSGHTTQLSCCSHCLHGTAIKVIKKLTRHIQLPSLSAQ